MLKTALTCTRFNPWMLFFTSFISFTFSAAFNSVSFTVKWVFSFFAGASSSSAAWFYKEKNKIKKTALHTLLNHDRYFKYLHLLN